MPTLKKLILPKVTFNGVQCPYHHPEFTTEKHSKCIKEWTKVEEKRLKNSIEYKNMEIINYFIDQINNGKTNRTR